MNMSCILIFNLLDSVDDFGLKENLKNDLFKIFWARWFLDFCNKKILRKRQGIARNTIPATNDPKLLASNNNIQ